MKNEAEMLRDIDIESVRRTELAAERTWLAWWRTGIAATATAIAVGGVVPRLVDGSRTPFVVLGCCYALLAVAIFVAAYRRQRTVLSSIEGEQPVNVNPNVVAALTLAGAVLALATVIVIVLAE